MTTSNLSNSSDYPQSAGIDKRSEIGSVIGVDLKIVSVTASNPIVLYDGVCGLCNHLVQFLLKRDTHNRLRFASLQSEFSRNILKGHGADPDDLDTVYVIKAHGQPDQNLLVRSDAILYLLVELGGIW